VNPSEMLEVLERLQAVERGHFRLSSGRHSDLFVQKFRLFEHPRLTQRFGEELSRVFAEPFDVVASPAVGAIVLGFAVALASERRMVFAEREGGVLAFRRGFSFAPHERVLVVEDVVTTGGSVRETVELVRRSGGEPMGVAALIDRGDPERPASLGAPLRALLRLAVASWEEASCPLCAAGGSPVDPGSRRAASGARHAAPAASPRKRP
jgi:orotate phosphoribosyltransferase